MPNLRIQPTDSIQGVSPASAFLLMRLVPSTLRVVIQNVGLSWKTALITKHTVHPQRAGSDFRHWATGPWRLKGWGALLHGIFDNVRKEFASRFPPNLQPQVNEKLALEVAGTALSRYRGLSCANQVCFVPGLQGQWEWGLFNMMLFLITKQQNSVQLLSVHHSLN